MKRLFAVLCVLLWVSSSVLVAGEGQKTTYGAGVTLDTPVAIGTLIQDPDTYVGKPVRIDGVVTSVCKKRGCWMQVTDPDTGNGIRMKVEDGAMVFPLEAMGQKASAEGIFRAIKLTPEQVEKMSSSLSDQHAKEHSAKDGADHKEGESCKPKPIQDTIFQLEGTGAIIYG